MSLDIYLMVDGEDVHWQNVTHNLNRMAAEAGVYEYLWRPDECGVTTARQLAVPLRLAAANMRADPDRFRRFDDAGGWGTYDAFVPWLENLLGACVQYPDATVRVSR